ncbi:hypothetical protein, partial [Bacillus cereus group sp. Bc253]|uniref:hypothetical protein n=1 Tax=Bacillus cereus group sp. Bc253 TaxID=3018103 RepID=UPI003F1F4F42
MASDVGPLTIPTGTTGNIDVTLPFTPTKMDLFWQGATILPGHGHQRGSDAWCFSDEGNVSVNK